MPTNNPTPPGAAAPNPCPAPPAPPRLVPLPVRLLCTEPDGGVCRFNLWGRCCHSRNTTAVCPLKQLYPRR